MASLAFGRSLLLALVIACTSSTAACSKDPCKTMWEKARKCENLPGDGLAEMIESCRADANLREAARRTLECGRRCDALEPCFREATRQVDVETVAERAEPFVREGNWDMVHWTCLGPREATDSERAQVEQDCAPYLRQGFDVLTEKLTGARDGGVALDTVTDKDERAYLHIAEQLGASEQAQAELLLSELRGKWSLEYTRAEVSEQLREDSPSLAWRVESQCSRSLELLGEIDSDWARGSAREVAKLCYLDLGQAILESSLDTTLGCTDVERIIEGIEAHDLTSEKAAGEIIATFRAEQRCAWLTRPDQK
jgi:hypothetical protein